MARRVRLVIHINSQTCYETKIVKTPYERTLWIPRFCGHYDIYVKRPRRDQYIVMVSEDWDKLEKVYKLLKESCLKYPINCLSLHPMFGPGIKNPKNYVIIALRVGGTSIYENLVDDFLKIFRKDGFIVTETTPELHDKIMALTLGVPHMLNILFLNLLYRSNQPLNDLTRYTGTTFLLQKVFAESIIQREMEMFGDIQMENKEFHHVLKRFLKLVKEYTKIITRKDKKKFIKLFQQGLDYSIKDLHFNESYDYFYKFMKILKNNS